MLGRRVAFMGGSIPLVPFSAFENSCSKILIFWFLPAYLPAAPNKAKERKTGEDVYRFTND